MNLFYNIAFFLALAARVQASVYATRPVKNTVFMAGQPWIEDGRKPLLKKMGPMQIDLYTESDTYVSTLAKNVPATSPSRTVFIPTWIPSNVVSYNIRFMTTYPHSISYTADFSILGGTGDPLSTGEDDPTVDGDPQDPNGITSPNPNDPQDPNDPTITDPNSPGYKDPNAAPNSNDTSTTATATATATEPPPPVSTIIPPPLGKGDIGSSTPTPTPNSGLGSGTPRLPYSAAARSGADLETFKFRIAFILWLAVIGISMAL